MRILRIDAPDGLGTLDLHPFVTVVPGCTPADRERLADVVRRIARGDLAGLSALVEDGGTLVDLSRAVEGVIGAATMLDVVVPTELDDASAGSVASPAELAQLDQLDKELEMLAVSREVVRGDLASDAAYTLAQLERSRRRYREHEASIGAARLVRELLEGVDRLPSVIEVADDGAADLLAEWRDFRDRRGELANTLAELAGAVQRAEVRAAAAADGVRAARERAKPRLLEREDERRLDELVLQAPAGRFSRKKGPSEEEEAEMAAILAKVRQPSYTAYQMYRLDPTPLPEDQAAVTTAEQELTAASQQLDEARRQAAEHPQVAALAEEEQDIRRRAVPLLGPAQPSDLEPALSSKVVVRPNPEWQAAVSSLRDASHQLGLAVPDDLDAAEVAPLVAQQLAEREASDPAADLERLEIRLEKERNRKARHDRAANRLVQLEQREREIRSERSAIADAVASRGTRTDPALTPDELGDRLERLVEGVLGEAGSSVPVMVEGDLGGLDDDQVTELLDWISERADRIQFVVATNRPAARTWAERVGLHDALVTAPRSLT